MKATLNLKRVAGQWKRSERQAYRDYHRLVRLLNGAAEADPQGTATLLRATMARCYAVSSGPLAPR